MPSMEWSRQDAAWIKECTKCKSVFKVVAEEWDQARKLMLDHFATASHGEFDELYSWCRSCTNDRKQLRTRGITAKSLYSAQEGKCSICKKPITLFDKGYNMDHDHSTEKLRGLLCCRCNIGMHYVDDEEWLAKAMTYRSSFK
jgi:Recombination endonuclease VII